MLTMDDVAAIERKHYEAICCASDTGGLSLAESADQSARVASRLLWEYRLLAKAHEQLKSELRRSVVLV